MNGAAAVASSLNELCVAQWEATANVKESSMEAGRDREWVCVVVLKYGLYNAHRLCLGRRVV